MGVLVKLEEQVARRGIYAALEDVRSGLRLVDRASDSSELLTDLERLLDREAHNLFTREGIDLSLAFIQQLYLRACLLGLPVIAQQAKDRLANLEKSFFNVLWFRSSGSRALRRTLVGSRPSFDGNNSFVGAVAISEDARWIISGYGDGVLRVWDFSTGQLLRSFPAHEREINALCMVPGHPFVLSASDDYTLRLWDVETGQLVRAFIGHNHGVLSALILPDGRRMVSADWEGTVRLWDLWTGSLLKRVVHAKGRLSHLASFGLRSLVLAVGSHWISVWDPETGTLLAPPLEGLSPFAVLAVTPDERLLVTDSSDHLLEVWDLAQGLQLHAVPRVRGNKIFRVAFLPDGRKAVMAFLNRTVEVWDTETGRQVAVLLGHEHFVRDVAVSFDGQYVASASNDGTVRIWDLSPSYFDDPSAAHQGPVDGLAWFAETDRLASTALDGWLRIWCAKTGKALSEVQMRDAGARFLVPDPTGKSFFSVTRCGEVRQWNLEGGEILSCFPEQKSIGSLAVSPDGSRLVSGADDGILHLWDVATGQTIGALSLAGLTGFAALLVQERRIVVGAMRLYLVDPDLGGVLSELEVATGYSVTEILSLPGGERILIASGAVLQLWDLAEPKLEATLEGHREFVTALAVTSDGRFAASGSYDRDLKLWDLECLVELATISLDGNIRSVAMAQESSALRVFVGDMIGNLYAFRFHFR